MALRRVTFIEEGRLVYKAFLSSFIKHVYAK